MFRCTVLAILTLQTCASIARSCSPPTIQLSLGNCTFSVSKQTVQSWGILLGVGRSEQLCGMVSTVVNSTLLQSSEICSERWLTIGNVTMTPAQCRSRRGGFITRDNLDQTSTNGLNDLNPGWVRFMTTDKVTPFEYAAKAALQFRDESITMTTGLITQGQQHTTSHIGLGEQSVLLESFKDAGLIGFTSWGLNSGSQSYLLPRDGSLVLGGFDESSVHGPFFNYSIAKPNMLNNRPCPLQVHVTGMTLKISDGNGTTPIIRDFYSAANKLSVCLEPYDNLFRLPYPDLQDIITMFSNASAEKATPVDSSQYQGLYNLEPGLVFPSSVSNFSLSLEITMDNGQTVIIPSHELIRPLRGLDTNGIQIVDTRFNEVQIYSLPAPEDGPVFGKAFLSQLYLYVDFENSMIRLAKQNLEANTPLPKSSASCPSKTTLSKTDKGLIAVGVVLAVIVTTAVLYVTYRWLTKRWSGHVLHNPAHTELRVGTNRRNDASPTAPLDPPNDIRD